jgi:hypothetical protein
LPHSYDDLEVTTMIPPDATPREQLAAEVAKLEARLATCSERIVELLAFGLALEKDRPLRQAIQSVAPKEPCALVLGDEGPFVEFAEGSVNGAGTIAGQPPPLPLTFDVREALRGAPALAEVVRTRLRVSGAQGEATRLVSAVLRMGHGFSANDFRKVVRWAPLLAPEAYRYVAISQMLRDETRALLRRGPSDRSLRWYWDHIHALSHMTLLATSALPTAWLVEMAKSFAWHTWTPSFPLVRERMFRLTLRGAWAAARFGADLVDRYLRAIFDARHPLRTFDAVLGVTAVALASPGDTTPIIRAIVGALGRRMARATGESDRLVAEACERSVELVVTHPELAERLTLKRGRARSSGLASRIDPAAQRLALFLAVDDETDGAEIDGEGFMPAILAMPTIATAPAAVFFATSAAERTAAGKWTVTRARVVLERTGGVMQMPPCHCGSGRPAEECCAN